MARKKLKGKIKRLSGVNTITVEVVRVYHHPLYRKRIRVTKRYLAHFLPSGEQVPQIGQDVTIEETRPLSARKHWLVIEVGGKPMISGKQKGRPDATSGLVASDAMISEKPKAGRDRRSLLRLGRISRKPKAVSRRRRSSK